ncbi:ABC transporter A family member [Lachnellula subtilissima]|uniref:ABC transporter A family member n=1 Tax=Lachnellula subtilissima TaxID=602034 RepID=A0A8H8UJ07_9HELO|nr:ABC transporter A family member [Lachnellula subtilissima]
MATSTQRPRWQRIYRQTLTLTYKNFLIFYKTPISLILRALVFPIAVTLIFSFLKHIGESGSSYDDPFGISATSFPVKDLPDAMKAASKQKLAFVRNGISNETLGPIIDGVLEQSGMNSMQGHSVDDPNDLFFLCQQSTQGTSDCFAAVIFLASNNTMVEYSIALDDKLLSGYGYGNYQTDDTVMAKRVLPLQWALDSHIGGFQTVSRPSVQPYGGSHYSSLSSAAAPPTHAEFWLDLVGAFVAPVFILILIGVVILSTFISFFAVYFPGFLISSILLTQILFTRTSDILFLWVTLLAGASLIASSHFLASFFAKAQLAGLYTSTLAFALALVTLAASLTSDNPQTQVTALAAIFPPCTYATLVGDVATREYYLRPFSLAPNSTDYTKVDGDEVKYQFMNGYLYVVFLILQIVVYSAATYGVEHGLWGVSRTFGTIEASSDVAVRCTGLSKTYYGKRPWYWPFMHKGGPIKAVSDLNLEVKKGSVTFLLGPNGGGKTTTLKCVAGMTAMDPGSQLELNEAGLVFGICPQSNIFWDSLTVQEHIKIWRQLKTAAFEDLTVDDDDVLVECDLLGKAGARAKTLSGGQMRKLQLAISFVGGSKVCCIDEASSGLDPLSRRNIWNIIQKGHARRTILVTTHFLDEADVLADHIAIVYKGKLVCEGPGTSLKARFGDNYLIRCNNDAEDDNLVWRSPDSAEATRKIIELEELSEDNTFNVVFPTLEQVFLKVTSDSHTTIRDHGGDGIVGEEENETVIDEKIFALEQEDARDIDLDIGHSIGLARQVSALFNKRYLLLMQKAGWISYGIDLIIPIIIAAALAKFVPKFDALQTCATNDQLLRAASSGSYSSPYSAPTFAPLEEGTIPSIYVYTTSSLSGYQSSNTKAILGPTSEWNNTAQDELYASVVSRYFSNSGSRAATNSTWQTTEALATRAFVNTADDMIAKISNSTRQSTVPFTIFAPSDESAVMFYETLEYEEAIGESMIGFSIITNRIANSTTKTGIAKQMIPSIRSMRHAENKVDFRSMPIDVLIALSFIAAASIAVIYPAFEKNNRVRALQYCNGVSPFALWLGYLLFDLQLIVIQAFIVWGILFAGSAAKVWYAPSYILGVFILFGIATYLGTYVLSLFTKKAAFAIAAGVHVLLSVLYLVGYIMNQSFGNSDNLHETYSAIQYAVGLTSPGANLLRALFLANNSFEILCGKYGVTDTSNPFAYVRYGSVYANFFIQIIFLIAVLGVYEYGSADWVRRNITNRGIPARLHYIVESNKEDNAAALAEKNARANKSQILDVSRISKFFGKVFAVENVSFSISQNETLALLGGNGAGKTTVINMIRSELKPDFGSIHLDGVSVQKDPHRARLNMGVCPQDDAIDNLTVRQTLSFYATVKGLKSVVGNVDKVLNALNIASYQDLSVKALSGGTRRKLSVAIALLGNPRVLLLDEPSTGQDAGAKRILWKALQDISANRAILLTTHSMEEAEALATNVAIMGTKMLATGTLTSLQESHGGAYSVRAVRAPGTNAQEVKQVVQERFGGRVANYVDGHGQVSFNLPHKKRALGSIMKIMEGLKGDVVEDEGHVEGSATGGRETERFIQDYTIQGPTLEEVFMNVARENGDVGIHRV